MPSRVQRKYNEMVQEESLNNLSPFQKGRSGNPKGRPRGSKNRAALVKKWMTLAENVTNPITKEKQWLTQEDLMTLSMIYAVRQKQDVAAYKILMDARFGTETGKLEINNNEGVTKDGFISFEIVDPVFNQSTELEIGANQ